MSCVLFLIRVPYNEQTGKDLSDDEDVEKVEILSQNDNCEPKTPDIEYVSLISSLQVLQNTIISCNIQGCAWSITNDNLYHQVMFLEECGERVDVILKRLTDVGIGIRPKTSVSIVPTSVHIGQISDDKHDDYNNKDHTEENSLNENEPLIVKKPSPREAFIKSVKSKLTVEQVVEAVKTQALLTFDYVMFTILASMIAAVGLVENNSVVLVASMLVSPLMGPILGVTFGNQIKNHSLRNIGLKTELCGLLTSVIVGFIFGFICGPFGIDGASWDINQDTWPTIEMSSRGMLRGWWVGVLIALPSGAGVALSVLGGNAGSLVGVAISASLLPPAVNSGMLWAYSIICTIKHPILESNTTQVIDEHLGCFPLKNNHYKPIYSCNMAEESAIMASVSLFLTIVNIICILITGTLVLKLKEVAPATSSTNATQSFWTKDVKVAREAYQTLKGDKATLTLKDTFLKEWKKTNELPGSDQSEDSSKPVLPQTSFELLDLVQELEEDPMFQNIVSRAPRGQQKIHGLSQKLRRQLSADLSEDSEIMSFRPFWTVRNTSPVRRRRLETVFEVDQDRKPEQKAREFVVTETGKPHLTSVVTVTRPTKETDEYSVKTESGV